MKRLAGLLAVFLFLALAIPPAWAADVSPVSVSAEAYLVMDADTGQVILGKNADEVLYPASIIKILILGLACEKAQGDWSQQLTVTQEVLDHLEQGAAHIALQVNEVVTLEDMLYATCMESACDAACMLAIYVGGSVEGGVEAMNAKAQQLGASSSHFSNPTGLHDEQLYSTARDMGIITKWALEQPGFTTVFGQTDTWVMDATNIQDTRYFHVDDYMRLSGYNDFRTYALGSKSGWHNEAQFTHVTYAEQGNLRLVGVLLKDVSRDAKFADMTAILDYAFANFQRVTLTLEGQSYKVPVWGGGKQLGEITVSGPESLTILTSVTAGTPELQVQASIPERYVLGTAFSPAMVVELAGTSGQSSASFAVPARISGLDTVLAANTYRATRGTAGGSWLAWAIALLLVGGSTFVLYRRLYRTDDLPSLMLVQGGAGHGAPGRRARRGRTPTNRPAARLPADYPGRARRSRSDSYGERRQPPRRQG